MEHCKEQTHLFDTASSDFYPRRSQEILRSTTATPKHSYADRSLVEVQAHTTQGLQSQASRIREVLSANQMRIERLECKEELRNYVKETNEELQIIHAKNQAETALVKDGFEKNMGNLEREVQSLKREWKNFKEKQEEGLADAVMELKTAKHQNQQALTSLLKDTNVELKHKFSSFGKELKDLKKARLEKKGGLMQELDLLRCTFNEKIEAERKKRAEYEQIVLILLDKTCEQGERILRRIC